jgi:hypothetical protein
MKAILLRRSGDPVGDDMILVALWASDESGNLRSLKRATAQPVSEGRYGTSPL